MARESKKADSKLKINCFRFISENYLSFDLKQEVKNWTVANSAYDIL